MQSILLITKKRKNDQITNILSEYLGNNDYLISFVETENNSLGIKELSDNLKNISLKKDKLEIIVIKDSFKLTTEAQNSILKTLEEPFGNILIVIHSNSKDKILETILSRCLLIEESDKDFLSEDNNIEYLFRDFASLDYLSRDKLVEEFLSSDKNKEDIKEALTNIIKSLKKAGKEDKVNVVLSAYKSIDYNVGSKLIFDYICLNI